MRLTSIEYVLFVAIAAAGYHLLSARPRRVFVVLASLVFYGTLAVRYIPLLLGIVVLTFFAAIWIQGAGDRKRGQTSAFFVALLLVILGSLKYIDFAGPAGPSTSGSISLRYLIPASLPLGFSFLIFTAVSYLIDVKRGRLSAEKNFFSVAAYLLFFPKLVQGPIERAGHFIAQIKAPAKFDDNLAAQGLKRILWGFFKKMVVADRLAIYSDAILGHIDQHNGISLLIAVVFFSFRIYADFSGYTDIALGTAEIFGIRLSENFRRPYFSGSITEFWNRWHISLSTWLRDYVFLPLAYSTSRILGKPRYLFVQTELWIYALATMVTFALCGLWHGNGWNFLIWGLIYGVYLTSGRVTQKMRKAWVRKAGLVRYPRFLKGFRIIFTLILVMFAWVFFAVPRVADALTVIRKIATEPGSPYGVTDPEFIYGLIAIGLFFVFEALAEFYNGRVSFFQNRRPAVRYLSYAALVIGILMVGVLDSGHFIYFQF